MSYPTSGFSTKETKQAHNANMDILNGQDYQAPTYEEDDREWKDPIEWKKLQEGRLTGRQTTL